MITSRVTTKAQTTIPRAVRLALEIAEGDTLVYELVDGAVVMRRLEVVVPEDPFTTFEEWGGDADTRAYAEL